MCVPRYMLRSKLRREPAVFQPFVSFEADGDVHNTAALELEKSNLPIVLAAGGCAEKQARNFLDFVPDDHFVTHGAEYIAFVDAYRLFGRDENRIGSAQDRIIKLLARARLIAVGDRCDVYTLL